LPELRATDLRGRRVLHEVEDGRGASALEPGREVLEPDADVLANARLRDPPAWDRYVEQIARLREEIGCGIVEVSFAAPMGSVEAKQQAMTLFAREVMPALRHTQDA